jgi:hypothetical protein
MKTLTSSNLSNSSLLLAPIVLTAVFSSVEPVKAASLNGQFHLDGGVTYGSPPVVSKVTLSKNQLIFSPDPTPVKVSLTTGSFTPFNSASIKDILSFNAPFTAQNPFLDFGYITPVPGVTGYGSGDSTITDGLQTFTLSQASYALKQSGANVSIDVALWGNFLIGGNSAGGAGNLTFQTNNTTVAAVQSLLDNGGSLNASFSGALFTTVPEPLTILGTAVAAGLGFTMKRRQKNCA